MDASKNPVRCAEGLATAVYLFEFHWSGIINEKPASGLGRGTSVLIKEADRWLLLVEHLGPKEVAS